MIEHPAIAIDGTGAGSGSSAPLSGALVALAAERSSACLLDDRLRFVAVNAAWEAFARANGGTATCLGLALAGTTYHQHVEGAAPRSKVERELARALMGRSVAVESECSTPDLLRLIRTHYLPVRDADPGPITGVLVVHTTLREAPFGAERPAAAPDEATYRAADGLISVCSCCRRVRRALAPPGWDFVPAYLASPPAGVSHVLCAACATQFGLTPEELTGILGPNGG